MLGDQVRARAQEAGTVRRSGQVEIGFLNIRIRNDIIERVEFFERFRLLLNIAKITVIGVKRNADGMFSQQPPAAVEFSGCTNVDQDGWLVY